LNYKAYIFLYISIKIIKLNTKAKENSKLVNFIIELILELFNKISIYNFRIELLIFL
jgi:hypothetical protein